MSLRPAGSSSGSGDRRARRLWLGAVLAACLAGAASAQAKPFVYVANEFSSSVSQYDATGGTLSPLTPPMVAVVAAGSFPTEVAVSPDGKNVYVANGFSNSVSEYDVGVGGALSAKTPAFVAAGIDPFGVAVSPDDKSVYVTNEFNNSGGPSSGTVSQYDVGPGGALTPKTPATVATGAGPQGVAVNADGKSVYVINAGSNPSLPGTVAQYSIDPVTGALSPKTPAAVATGAGPRFVAVSRDGKSVYVTNESGNTVSQYNVGGGGALTPKNPATVAAGTDPQGLAVSPDSKSIYVINAGGLPPVTGTVSQYNVDPLTGALSPKSPATVATGVSPFGVVVSPEGKSVYVTNFNNFVTPNIGSVSQYDVGAGGALTPKTPATVATGIGPLGIAVTPLRAGTAGCRVHGHGRITAANGDQASFRGGARATPPSGEEHYRDNGPANALRVRSLSVDAVTCSADATQARILGNATINGAGSVEYRIDVQLPATRGGKDTYRIRLSTGYDSGAQPIRHGDIDIRLRASEHHHHDANAEQDQASDHQDGG
jgi:DNA-binding beta-propeller fold protein YncE